jgi:hypothetical protein
MKGGVMSGDHRPWSRSHLASLSSAILVALAVAACGGSGSARTATTPRASASTGQVQPAQRVGHLGDAIPLSVGGGGRLEVTALALKSYAKIRFTRGTAWNVCGIKLKLRNAGTTPIHLAGVGPHSVLIDVGGWRYDYPGDNPRNALYDVVLGQPGDSRVGWVYFTTPTTGAAPSGFRYTAMSSEVTAEGDTGLWRWRPL